MSNLVKAVGVATLVLGLAACDGNSGKDKNTSSAANTNSTSSIRAGQDNTTPAKNTSNAGTTGTTTDNTSVAGESKSISALDGKVTFSIPNGLTEQPSQGQSGSLTKTFTSADGKTVVAVVGVKLPENATATDEQVKTGLSQVENALKAQDSNARILNKKEVQVNGSTFQSLEAEATVASQKMYSATIMGVSQGMMFTITAAGPQGNSDLAQNAIKMITSTLKVSN